MKCDWNSGFANRCNSPHPSGDARCCFATALLTFYPGTLRAASLLVALVPRLGGLGCQFFLSRSASPRGVSEGCCFSQPAVLKAHTGTLQCGPHPAGGWWFSTGSGPASTVPHGRSGAACRCWLGPCPHDPLRCGLNSSPSYNEAMCNLPQFAKSLRG